MRREAHVYLCGGDDGAIVGRVTVIELDNGCWRPIDIAADVPLDYMLTRLPAPTRELVEPLVLMADRQTNMRPLAEKAAALFGAPVPTTVAPASR